MSATYWTENDWIEFAQLALSASKTDVARGKGWSENLLHVARDAVDIAIEINAHSAGEKRGD